MKLDFEYGTGTMAAELPDERTDVFIPRSEEHTSELQSL